MRIFSGIQPSGDPHIGNYSGGFRQYAETQEQGEAFFCIVDLHAITIQHDPTALREGTLDIAAMLFATGLDPERSTVFVQSHVTAHAEAAWLLSSVASYGQLGRMTQFKEKASSSTRPTSFRSATTSGSISSSRATSRSASTRATARPSSCRKASSPKPAAA